MLVAKQHLSVCLYDCIMRLQGALVLMDTIQVTVTFRRLLLFWAKSIKRQSNIKQTAAPSNETWTWKFQITERFGLKKKPVQLKYLLEFAIKILKVTDKKKFTVARFNDHRATIKPLRPVNKPPRKNRKSNYSLLFQRKMLTQ